MFIADRTKGFVNATVIPLLTLTEGPTIGNKIRLFGSPYQMASVKLLIIRFDELDRSEFILVLF